jgi:ketol-acid reductoisomerase
MKDIDLDVIGHKFDDKTKSEMDNAELVSINKEIRSHSIEEVGERLRTSMTSMKSIL